MKTYIKWQQYAKSGILIPELTVEHEANTLVKAFWQHIIIRFTVQTITMIDTGNTSRAVTTAYMMNIMASSGIANRGTLVGTGTDAVQATDYKLQTPIEHGSGAGQLQYSAQGCDSDALTSGADTYFTTTRRFDNNSGGSITINEVGLAGYANVWYFLLDRSLSTYAIADGNYAICTYKLGTS